MSCSAWCSNAASQPSVPADPHWGREGTVGQVPGASLSKRVGTLAWIESLLPRHRPLGPLPIGPLASMTARTTLSAASVARCGQGGS